MLTDEKILEIFRDVIFAKAAEEDKEPWSDEEWREETAEGTNREVMLGVARAIEAECAKVTDAEVQEALEWLDSKFRFFRSGQMQVLTSSEGGFWRHMDGKYSILETIRRALSRATPAGVDLEKAVLELKNYYLPQLKFKMDGHRDFAKRHPKAADHHNGAANALEVAIGCIEEALEGTIRRALSAPVEKIDGLAEALNTQSIFDHATCYGAENALPSVIKWARRDLRIIEQAARAQLKRQEGV